MIYLDYAATVPPKKELIADLIEISQNYPGNPNAKHQLGINGQRLIEQATKQIAELLSILPKEIIYTSGASEANNHVIKMVAAQYSNRGKKIITTRFEHPSVLNPLLELEKQGFKIEYLKTDKNGIILINHLEKILTKDVILVSIASVNSEIGLQQPISKIAKILKNHRCFFHSDVTQSIGKQTINFQELDFASFSGHKFGALKGIGVLYKKNNINLKPLIIGGDNNLLRGGTPPLELIVIMAKALRLAYENYQADYLQELNRFLKLELSKIDNVIINSNQFCIANIINFSILNKNSETILNAFSAKSIYLSTKTACSDKKTYSKAVYHLTNDLNLAKSSLRVSISNDTSKEELKDFIKNLKLILKTK